MKNTKSNHKIPLFKGQYIEEFLSMERHFEKIIEVFFTEPQADLDRNFVFGKEYSEKKEVDVKLKNMQNNLFLNYGVFADPFFGFKQKTDWVKLIIQIIDPSYFAELKKLKVFIMVEYLNKVRNIFAHNTTLPTREGMMGYKKSNKFTAKEKDYTFVPTIDTFIITEKIKKELMDQLKIVNSFFYTYWKNDYRLNREQVNLEYSNRNKAAVKVMFSIPKVSRYDVGVFKLFLSEEEIISIQKQEAKDLITKNQSESKKQKKG